MTATHDPTSPCPDPATLAEFIDGTLDQGARSQLETHLAQCDACYENFAEAIRTVDDCHEADSAQEASPRGWYLAAAGIAATLVCVLGAVAYWQNHESADGPLERLVAAVGTNRFIEARMSAPFAWGSRPSPLRGGAERPNSAVQRAAIDLQEAAAAARTSVTDQRAALGYLAVGNVQEAVPLLENAVRLAPAREEARVDLSAALLARWSADGVVHDATRALGEAEAALQLRPDYAPALFNKALALEALGMTEAARRAWQAYLDSDGTSPWATEAHERLQKLYEPDATAAGADTTAIYGDAEESIFPRWASSVLDGGTTSLPDLAAFRRRAVAAGADRQLIDELDTLMTAPDWPTALRHEAARAMSFRGEWNRHYQDGDHERALRAARQWRASASVTPLPALPADVAISLSEFSMGQAEDAVARLRRVAPELERRRYWRALARVHNVRGVIELQSAAYSSGVAEYQLGLSAATNARDFDLVSALEALIGEAIADQGDTAAAWHHVGRAVAALSRVRSPRARFGVLATAAIMAADDAPGAAYRFADELLLNSRTWANPGGQVLAHLQRAAALAKLGQESRALQDLTDARTWKHRIADLNLAAQFQTEIDIAEARVLAKSDPTLARMAASRAIEALESQRNFYRSASLLLLRGRIAMRMGDASAAERDWEHGAHLIEDKRENIREEQLRISRLDHVWEVFSELVGARVGRPLEALETVERLHARELLATLGKGPERESLRGADLYSWLPAHVSVLTYAALPERLLIWVVAADGTRLVTRSLSARTLTDMVSAYRAELAGGTSVQAASALAAELIPDDLPLSPEHPLVIIPDGPLHDVSFATLTPGPTRAFLAERATLLVAPSLSVLKLRTARGRPTHDRALLVGYGRPDAAAGLSTLPLVSREVRTLSSLYRSSVALVEHRATPSAILAELPKASVVHIAAHAILDRAHPSRSRFIVAPENGRLLDAAALGAARLQSGSVVMLSACESAGGRSFRGEGAMSLVRPFLAAGAGAVVGALWPITDEGAAMLSVEFHARLATATPGQALATVQRDAIAAGRPRTEWGAFVVYGGLN